MKSVNGLTISISNSKLGSFIPTINMPPIVTCRKNCPCAKNCYACKGNFARFESVKKTMQDNLHLYKNNNVMFFDDVNEFLQNGLTIYKYLRWHSAGDIVDANYFLGMVEIAKANPLTRFLAFTKKFEIVNEYIKNNGELPQNLRIVFSAWDKDFKVENPYNLPVAYIDLKDKSKNAKIPETAIPCNGNCEKCLACWSLQKGQSVFFKQH